MKSQETSKIRPVILCGGQGTRLWPVSRSSYPKQFARLFSEQSLLQETISLVSDNSLYSEPIFIGAREFEHIIGSHVRQMGIQSPIMILEPEGRNTAAAVALACSITCPGEILLVLPSDHVISEKKQFAEDVRRLTKSAQDGKICIFGVAPGTPSSDFGYIEIGEKLSSNNPHYTVKRFNEKPDRETAQKYIEEGTNYWNAGIFLFSKETMTGELNRYARSVIENSEKALACGRRFSNRRYPATKIFRKIPSLPIDIAVMEKTTNAVVALANFKWLDIGSWNTYATLGEQDEAGNSVSDAVILEDCHNNFIQSDGKLVTAIGLSDLAIVDTADALLIMHKSSSSELPAVVKTMRSKGVEETVSHRKVRRPWGSYEGIHQGAHHQVKHIIVKPGEKLSSQYHHYRAEHWIVVKGGGIITIGTEEIEASENDSCYIPSGEIHRLDNPFKEDLHLIEVQFGKYLGEDDIVRLDDIYGRSSPSEPPEKRTPQNTDKIGEMV